MARMLDRKKAEPEPRTVRALIVFVGPGTKRPAFVFEDTDPLQVLVGLEAIDNTLMKVESKSSPLTGCGSFELTAAGPDAPITRATAYGLTWTQQRAALILLRLWAKQMANRFIAVSMQPPQQAESPLLIPRH